MPAMRIESAGKKKKKKDHSKRECAYDLLEHANKAKQTKAKGTTTAIPRKTWLNLLENTNRKEHYHYS